ncbi:MAG: hypothetical protein FWD52_04210 [Candidatus Bathyarchaeota archaeon]|nr:hypothetical protein [Candidatus Termiticorpusculum sp.]
MKIKRSINFIVFGLLITSLSVLQPTQAQQTTVYGEGFPHTADGEGFPMVSPISINSPLNTTYTTNQISLNFTLRALFNSSQGSAIMTYSLDGKDNVTLPSSIVFVPIEATVTDAKGRQRTEISQFASYYTIAGSVDLNLQPGQHNLTIFGHYTVYSMSDKVGLDSQTVYFTVDDGSLSVTSTVTSVDESAPNSEIAINMFYVYAGVFSLIAIAVCVLFIKHRTKHKIVNNSNITIQTL